MPVLIEAIDDDSLNEFCQFLYQNLSKERTVEQWMAAFQHPWASDRPNHGFMLLDQGTIVGGIGAIYSEQTIEGKAERFCNITSWCVLDAYRTHSMRLAIAICEQEGYHFTDFTPTEVVGGVLQFLKFKPLDERVIILPNWPGLGGGAKIDLLIDQNEIEAALTADELRVYRDHRELPWLNHWVVGEPGAYCYLQFKSNSWKNLPCATILYSSDAQLFSRYWSIISHHFLLKKHYLISRIERRFLIHRPLISLELSGYRNKVFRSPSLAAEQIRYIYSELVALDL